MHRRRSALAAAAIVGVLAAVATACGNSAGGGGPDAATHRALCEALSAAEDGDRDAARRVFVDDAHEGIHELASRLEPEDRVMAADLFEAKQAVEAHFSPAAARGGGTLVADLDALAVATSDGIAALGADPPPPCA